MEMEWVLVHPNEISSGRRTFVSEFTPQMLFVPLVRITFSVHLSLSGTFAGKPFDVKERQTDVLRWTDGRWKCVLTHETMLAE
jgi:hypothetical protein